MLRYRTTNRRLLPGTCALLACGIALLAGGLAAAAPGDKLPSATGRIQYKVSGPMQGSITLAWADHGMKFRQDMKVTAAMPKGAPGTPSGQPVTMNTWALSDGKNVYTSQSAAGNRVLRLKGMKTPRGVTNAPGGLGNILGQFTSQKGAKTVGKASLLGRTCEIRVLGQSKLWLWQGMPLRMELQGGGQGQKMVMVATKVESAPRLPASLFKLPAGCQVQDIDLSRGMQGGMPKGGQGRMPQGMPPRR